MTQNDCFQCGGFLDLVDPHDEDSSLELEVIVDPEEGLAWGIWWGEDNRLIAVFTAST